MTAEEWFSVFYEKYGDDFNWTMIPFTDRHFVEELKRELGDSAHKEKKSPCGQVIFRGGGLGRPGKLHPCAGGYFIA